MKITWIVFLLIDFHLVSCSQSISHDFHGPGKIPIEGKRWYQLNANASQDFGLLFDGNISQKTTNDPGKILDNYDAWYPILDGEQITIDSIMMFNNGQSDDPHPMTVYAILDNWQKLPIAEYTGALPKNWNGPDPKRPEIYALATPVSNIRYLVINSWGYFPSEIEFYGSYVPPRSLQPLVIKHVPLSNFFEVNAFEWDFEGAPDISIPDPKKVNAIKYFTGIRHYMDWSKLEASEGNYTFNPTKLGNWNYDTMYQWCKTQGIEVLACLKTIPEWMQESYPADKRNSENAPLRYGKNPADPQSYIEQSRVAFQYAARYGSNKKIAADLVTAGAYNKVRTGLNLIHYIECDNERDKWWKGRQAYQTGREYAANLSAFYDGDKNKMGPGVGVKNADPEMQVVMAGLAAPNTDYVQGIIDWSLQYRGKKPDGSVDLPFDVINYHYYNNDADYRQGKKQSTGMAPELTGADSTARKFVELAQRSAAGCPVWVTETGYDINQQSPQKAVAINGKPPLQTQADWILRTSLLYARTGIQKVFFYELVDDNPASNNIYSTSGLINADDRTPRPAADFIYQTNKLFGSYTYEKTISSYPIVDRYTCNGQSMYVLVIPDEKGKTATYTLDLGNAATAFVYAPRSGSNDMDVKKQKTVSGKVKIPVTETPVFVTGFDCLSNKKQERSNISQSK